jgi:ribosomal protein S19
MKEQSHYNRLCAAHSQRGRLFRNNTGTGYQGKQATIGGQKAILNPRLVNFGLCVGSSDLIGWTTVEITPEMIGQKVAIFTAVEVKKKGNKPTAVQLAFLKTVEEQGGIGKIELVEYPI